jgi:hypothetical protein
MTPVWRDPRHTFPIGDEAAHTAPMNLRRNATLICLAAVLAGLLPACGAVPGEKGDPTPGSAVVDDWKTGVKLLRRALADPSDEQTVMAAIEYTAGGWALEAHRAILGMETGQPTPRLGAVEYSVMPPELSPTGDEATLVACETSQSSVSGWVRVRGQEPVRIGSKPTTYRITATLHLVGSVWKTVEQRRLRRPGDADSCVAEAARLLDAE